MSTSESARSVGHDAGGLVRVDQQQRATLAAQPSERRQIVQRSGGEVDVAGRDQGGSLVDGRREVIERDGDAIRGGHHHQLDAERGAGQPLMPDRREVERSGHDPRSRPAAGRHAGGAQPVESGAIAAVDGVDRRGDDRQRAS